MLLITLLNRQLIIVITYSLPNYNVLLTQNLVFNRLYNKSNIIINNISISENDINNNKNNINNNSNKKYINIINYINKDDNNNDGNNNNNDDEPIYIKTIYYVALAL